MNLKILATVLLSILGIVILALVISVLRVGEASRPAPPTTMPAPEKARGSIDSLPVAWKTELDSRNLIGAPGQLRVYKPLVDKKRAYITAYVQEADMPKQILGTSIASIDLKTGKKLWTWTGSNIASEPPKAVNTRHLMLSYYVNKALGPVGYMAVLDARNGKELWRRELSGENTAVILNGAPAIEEDIATGSLSDGTYERSIRTTIFDAATGREVKTTTRPKPPLGEEDMETPPDRPGETFEHEDSTYFRLDFTTPWDYELGKGDWMELRTELDDEAVFVKYFTRYYDDTEYRMVLLDAQTGKPFFEPIEFDGDYDSEPTYVGNLRILFVDVADNRAVHVTARSPR